MAGPGFIEFGEEGIEEMEARLEKLIELTADLRPFWPLVVPLFVGWMGRQFEQEGAYLGEAWAELTPSYAAWKSQHYPGKGILSATGDLRKAATSPLRAATPTTLTLAIRPFTNKGGGTIDPAWFQDGTTRMVARPLLPEGAIPLSADIELHEAAEEYIQDTCVRLGLV